MFERIGHAPASAISTIGQTMTHPTRTVLAARALVEALSAVLRDGARAPACSFNVPVGPRRELAWVRGHLSSVKETGRRHGATLNDVILSAVAGGLRAQLLQRSEPCPRNAC